MRATRRGLLPPPAALLCGVLGAASTPAAQTTTVDEIVVCGSRAQLEQLRDGIVKLEDRFFELYNELNTVPEFDIRCRVEARTGTRIELRACRPVFEERAQEEEGQQALQMRQYIHDQLNAKNPNPRISGSPPAPPLLFIEARRPAFRQNMRSVVARDERLASLLQERDTLIKRYDNVRREIFGLDAPAGSSKEEKSAAGQAATQDCSAPP